MYEIQEGKKNGNCPNTKKSLQDTGQWGLSIQTERKDNKETKTTLNGLTQSLCEGLEPGLLVLFLVWVTDRMVLFVKVEPQEKE